MKKTILKIQGMHCPSCNILVEDKFKSLKNIKGVKANFKNQEAEIYFDGKINIDRLNKLIKPFGYEISNNIKEEFGGLNNWLDFVFILLVFIGFYFILKEINLLPNFNYSSLSLLTVFFLGIIASTSTCMATTGALYLAVSQKNNSFLTALNFSLGRIFSYGIFGFIFGIFGKQIINSIFFSGLLTFIIAFMMIFLGLELAKVFSWQKFFGLSIGSNLFRKIEEKIKKDSKITPFLLGASTYFLPCGFTQSVQVYAMGLGNLYLSALNMVVFSIGTIPLILFINQAIKIRQFNFYQYFLKISGVLIFVFGLNYLSNFLTIFGINIFDKFLLKSNNNIENVKLINEKQEIKMIVDSNGYYPSYFQVKKGIPVRWIIEGKNVLGCQGYLVVSKLNINQVLKEGENIFEFIPKEEGIIGFSCGMGMYKGIIEVKN